MNEPSKKVNSFRRKYLIKWCIRQIIGACIFFPIVHYWPHLYWLIPVWLVIAIVALIMTIVMLRKLEKNFEDIETKIELIHKYECEKKE